MGIELYTCILFHHLTLFQHTFISLGFSPQVSDKSYRIHTQIHTHTHTHLKLQTMKQNAGNVFIPPLSARYIYSGESSRMQMYAMLCLDLCSNIYQKCNEVLCRTYRTRIRASRSAVVKGHSLCCGKVEEIKHIPKKSHRGQAPDRPISLHRDLICRSRRSHLGLVG